MLHEPVVNKEFFGREEVLKLLGKRVSALKGGYRQNVALTGEALAGKSSILYQFLYSLKDTSIIPVYIEVLDEPFRLFADKFIATVLYSYLISCEKEVKNDLAFLIEASEPLIPTTTAAVRAIKKDLGARDYNTAYRKLLSLTSVLRQETGKSCVVILDEFHNLELFKIKKPYMHFGKIIMIQKDTMYIVSSSKQTAIRKILSEKLALLYGNFEIIEISGFNHSASAAFLKEKFSALAIDERLIGYLIEFTGGNPFYMTAIARKIKELSSISGNASVDLETLVTAITELVYTSSGTINQYLTGAVTGLIERELRKSSLDTLIAIAQGFNTAREIGVWLKKSKASFVKNLNGFLKLDIIRQSGVFYEINDHVLKFWLKNVYHKKKSLPVGDIIERQNGFKSALRQDMGEFFHERERPAAERIKELFSCFSGEMVEIDRKTKKLTRFSAIEASPSLSGGEMLACQSSGKYWACSIRTNKITEADIDSFLTRYNPMREKLARKICIALSGIEENALLLAKEKNIWIWGIDTLNNLLAAYRKRAIICS